MYGRIGQPKSTMPLKTESDSDKNYKVVAALSFLSEKMCS